MLSDGHVNDGLFEENEMLPKSKIKSYNPNVHKLGMKVDVDKYSKGTSVFHDRLLNRHMY